MGLPQENAYITYGELSSLREQKLWLEGQVHELTQKVMELQDEVQRLRVNLGVRNV